MTTQEIEHVKGCEDLMKEVAAKVGLSVAIEDYHYGKEFTKTVDISLRDKDGYLIYKSTPGDVCEIIGFIKGLQSSYSVFTPQ